VSGKERAAGRRGERRFCIHVKSHMDLEEVRGHLKRMVGLPAGKGIPSGTVLNCRVAKPSPACKT
jgi:hypothetical protein